MFLLERDYADVCSYLSVIVLTCVLRSKNFAVQSMDVVATRSAAGLKVTLVMVLAWKSKCNTPSVMMQFTDSQGTHA